MLQCSSTTFTYNAIFNVATLSSPSTASTSAAPSSAAPSAAAPSSTSISSSPASQTASPTPSPGSQGLATGAIAGIAVGGALGILVVCLIAFYLYKFCLYKKRTRRNRDAGGSFTVPTDTVAQGPSSGHNLHQEPKSGTLHSAIIGVAKEENGSGQCSFPHQPNTSQT